MPPFVPVSVHSWEAYLWLGSRHGALSLEIARWLVLSRKKLSPISTDLLSGLRTLRHGLVAVKTDCRLEHNCVAGLFLARLRCGRTNSIRSVSKWQHVCCGRYHHRGCYHMGCNYLRYLCLSLLRTLCFPSADHRLQHPLRCFGEALRP